MKSSASSDRAPRAKATLFCPNCDREGHVDDWIVRTTAARVRTDCPDCGSRVDERPRRPDRTADGTRWSGRSSVPGALVPVNVLVRLQRYVLDWWSRHGSRYVPRHSST